MFGGRCWTPHAVHKCPDFCTVQSSKYGDDKIQEPGDLLHGCQVVCLLCQEDRLSVDLVSHCKHLVLTNFLPLGCTFIVGIRVRTEAGVVLSRTGQINSYLDQLTHFSQFY